MADQQTYKRSLSKTIGVGMKSVMGSQKRSYYILEHKVPSKYHNAGEKQEIIIDQIDLGRDEKCQVRFDAERFPTVSRRHASIVRDGNQWKLIHLSSSNSTYLNGKIVTESYLHNGDEIKLSDHGPIIGFREVEAVNTLRFSRRLSLYWQQAWKPFKRTLISVFCCFVVFVLGISYIIYKQRHQITQLTAETENLLKELDEVNKSNDKLLGLFVNNTDSLAKMSAEIDSLRHRESEIIKDVMAKVVANGVDNEAIERCLPDIYFIIATGFEITFQDGTKKTIECGKKEDGRIPSWSGTGFLLSDGRLVTARHVIEPWCFPENEQDVGLNIIANNGGKVVALFSAFSSSGKKLSFRSEQFYCERTHDEIRRTKRGEKVCIAPTNTDFAHMNTNGLGQGLKFDPVQSNNLNRGTNLVVLGFPQGGISIMLTGGINPILGSGTVATKGLQKGIILTRNTNYEHGDSGGPVFCTTTDGDLVVVGIVEGGVKDSHIGFVVPISVIK